VSKRGGKREKREQTRSSIDVEERAEQLCLFWGKALPLGKKGKRVLPAARKLCGRVSLTTKGGGVSVQLENRNRQRKGGNSVAEEGGPLRFFLDRETEGKKKGAAADPYSLGIGREVFHLPMLSSALKHQ